MGIEDLNIDSNEHAERVLIIGGSEDSAGELATLLDKRGHQPIHADSITEASKLAVKELFDLIILDEQEPSTSPDELIAQVRSDLALKRSPLLLIHPDGDRAAETSVNQVGSDVQVLSGPFQASTFLVKVATQLRLRKFKTDQASFEVQIAAQNAELRDLTNRFKQELKEARAIQQAILPKVLPSAENTVFAAYCVPLEAVGGDLFDVWKIDQDRYGLFIGDVTGHGLPAAFIGAMTKMALAYASKDDPAAMLSNINDGMSDLMPEGRFVTVAAAIYQTLSGQLAVARGGHPPPYVWRAKSKEVEKIEPKGLPLGITRGAPYQLYETILEPGDKFLMVTDGFTETADMNGKMLGVDGVGELFGDAAEVMSIDKCLQEVLDGQHKFADGRIVKDDNTLVGLERLA